jgi:glycerophosphoryl diester phosphodiesterase
MMRVAAHRGGALLWPENSLLAFRNAVALGCDFVEFDVHQTADGEVAVIHDHTLDRTSEGRGAVGAATATALRRLRLKGRDGGLTDERVPLLEDVLALVAASPAALLVEIKGPTPGVGVSYRRVGGKASAVPGPRYEGLEDKVLAILGRAGLLERATLMAFNPDVLTRVRARMPRQRATLLVSAHHVVQAGARPEQTVDWALSAGATGVGLQHTLASEAVVRAARAADVLLGVWTVNDETAMRRLAALGVDVLTSDRPDLAVRVVRRAS